MITKRLNPQWQPKRPLRTFAITFFVIALLFCVATPFMDDIPNHWLFLMTGLVYAALLAFFSVGLCLLPPRIRGRTLMGLVVMQFLGFAIMLGILFIAHFQLSLSLLDFVIPVSLWAFGAAGVLLLLLSSYGWYHRFHDSTQVA